MVPFKTKQKPALMNKNTFLRPVLAILFLSATFCTVQQIKKNPNNSFFSAYVFLSNQIQVKG
jgi:hypothetical protein